MIKIGDTPLDATLTRSGDELTISMVSGMTLGELEALLDPGSAPEIRVTDDAGETAAIYSNHAVTALTVETVGEARQVTAALKVAAIEQTEADKLTEQLAKQAGILSEHDAALVEVAGMTADNMTLSGEAEAALVELADMVAQLMERVDALEARHTTSGEVS